MAVVDPRWPENLSVKVNRSGDRSTVRGHLIRRLRGQLPLGVSGGMDAPATGLSLRMGRWGGGQRTRAAGWRQETPARVRKGPL